MPHISFEELKELRKCSKQRAVAFDIICSYAKQLEQTLKEHNISINNSMNNYSSHDSSVQTNGDKNTSINVNNIENITFN